MPAGAHGISDAFRDAELLAQAVVDGDLARYGRQRDALSAGLFDALENLADSSWSMEELPDRHVALAKARSRERATVRDLWSSPTMAPATV